MTKLTMIQMLEDARIASWVNSKSWLMINGEQLMIAMNESDKKWLESKGYSVKAMFQCGEQIAE